VVAFLADTILGEQLRPATASRFHQTISRTPTLCAATRILTMCDRVASSGLIPGHNQISYEAGVIVKLSSPSHDLPKPLFWEGMISILLENR
jgi:hypothetical protein